MSLMLCMSWSPHGSPAFSLVWVCFVFPCLYSSSCVSPPVCSVCVCMWPWSPSTGSTRWIHSGYQPPIKPLHSLLLIARSFHHSAWLLASWRRCAFAFVSCWLACVANTPVFVPPRLRLLCLPCSLVFASSLPACFLLCPVFCTLQQTPSPSLVTSRATFGSQDHAPPLPLAPVCTFRTLKDLFFTVNPCWVVHLGPDPEHCRWYRWCFGLF